MSSISTPSVDFEIYDSDSSDSAHSYIYYSPTDRSTGTDDEDVDSISYPYPVPLKTKVKEAVPMSVANLMEIASLYVAIALWKHVNISNLLIAQISKDNAKNSDIELAIYNEVLKSTKDLPTPKLITKLIISHIDKIRKEIKDWVLYNYCKVFFDHTSYHYMYNHICYMVFYSNGTINRKETARNLFMNSFQLSEIEKYYLLCTYCLKDDLERLLPSLRTSVDINVRPFDVYPLISYWNYFLKGEMDKIVVPITESIDTFMIKHRGVDNWPAKEYFLNNLSFDEQVRMAVWLIDKHDMKYLLLLLKKLDDHQRFHVIALRAEKIMWILICTKSYFEEILSMWFEIRNVINENQFLMIFNLSVNAEYYEVVEAIWTTACSKFKDYVINAYSEEYYAIGTMLRWWTSDLENDIFFCIMQHADEDFKIDITGRSFFIQACEELIFSGKVKHLDRLLKTCFTDNKKLAKFKQEFVAKKSFGNYCEKLMNHDKCEMLQDLLNSFFTNAEELGKFWRNLTMESMSNKIENLRIAVNELLSVVGKR